MKDQEIEIAKPPAKLREGKVRSLAVLRPGRTGPRTKRGKQKSRHNAIRHAIFASGIVRKRESVQEYYAQFHELADTLQPVGKLERVLVEKLAMNIWRSRRLLEAEAAEIAREIESLEYRHANILPYLSSTVGLINMAVTTEDELGVGVALDLLKGMRDKIQQEGLDWARDEHGLRLLYGTKPAEEAGAPHVRDGPIRLRILYGTKPGEESKEDRPGPDIRGDLAKIYWELAESETKSQDVRSPKASSDRILAMIQESIDRLDRLYDPFILRSMQRRELERASSLVPKAEVMERLQRYEGSLERFFDRTLAQLERLQRLRLGQPVPPEFKVRLTH